MKRVEIDRDIALSLLPPRDPKGNKGSFGRALAIVGSEKYPGAMHLCIESLLRGGAGYTVLAAEKSITAAVLQKFPEVVFKQISAFAEMSLGEMDELANYSASCDSVVIGCGCGVSKKLLHLISALVSRSGSPIIIDADALNSIAKYAVSVKEFFRSAKRPLILTPHEMELSRLCGIDIKSIGQRREEIALELAHEWGVTLLLKGSGTVISDGEDLFVNSSGSSALAKGGSGDCLAGLIASLVASSSLSTASAAALAAYIHGAAGNKCAEEYSEYGVTPSDLPRAMAREMSQLCKLK